MSSKTQDLVGKQIGKFRIESMLGEGGMGAVYRAVDNLDRQVALKVIRGDLARNEQFAARFRREAKVAAKFDHPNAIEIFEFGDGSTTDGVLYMALEFVQGHELRDLIKAKGYLSPGRTVNILVQILDALEKAHELGIIHRDLKPQNIMIDARDRVKILDFGIAHLKAGDGTSALTQAGEILGTLAYMPPEQAEGAAVDARTDIYSLGVILFQMLTGKLPFKAKRAMALIQMHRTKKPPHLTDLRPDAPELFDPIVQKALAKKPEKRFSSARAMREALEALPYEPLAPVLSTPAPGQVGDTTIDGYDDVGGTSAWFDQLLGKKIDGEYFIIEKLGEGGMGAVFRAKSDLLGNEVALKVIHPELAGREDVRIRFLREARAALEFVHPNAIPTRACRQTAEGLLYMTQDFCPGKSLRAILEEEHRLSIPRALGLARQALMALSEAHAKGIVHRDLKPENMLVESPGSAEDELLKVCDFGIAKIVRAAVGEGEGKQGTSLTGKQVIGTPFYMAPEQAMGEDVDGRADLYAIGCVLYELVTGSRVFVAPNAMDVLMKQITNTPVPVRERAPEAGIPLEVQALVSKALTKSKDSRFQSAEAFIETIDRLGFQLPGRQGSRAVPRPEDVTATKPPIRARATEPGPGKWIALAVAVVLLLTLTMLVLRYEAIKDSLPGLLRTPLGKLHEAIMGSAVATEATKTGEPPRAVKRKTEKKKTKKKEPPRTPKTPKKTASVEKTKEPVKKTEKKAPPKTPSKTPRTPNREEKKKTEKKKTEKKKEPPKTPKKTEPVEKTEKKKNEKPRIAPVEPIDPAPQPKPVEKKQPKKKNKPKIVRYTYRGVTVRLTRIPNLIITRADGKKLPVRDLWLSVKPLTVRQYVHFVAELPRGQRRLFALFARKHLFGRPPTAKNLDRWIRPKDRDKPIRLPYDFARRVAQRLRLELPTSREWLAAARLKKKLKGKGPAVEVLDGVKREWVRDGRVGGFFSGGLDVRKTSDDRVVVRLSRTK